MKRAQLLSMALSVGFAGAAIGVPTPAEAKKGAPKLLLQDLQAKGVESHEASAISTAACHALAKQKKYDVLCGDDLRNMMQFGALASSFDGCQDEECYKGMAKALDARFVVSGKVTKLGKTYLLSLSMLDTGEAKTVGRTEIKADTIEALHRDTGEAISALVTKR